MAVTLNNSSENEQSARRRTTAARVAYVVHGMCPGGLERCVAELSNHLDRRRFEPLVICLAKSGDAARWICRDDVPVIELGKLSGNDFRVASRLAKLLSERNVDVAHSHNWGTLLETSIACRRVGVHHVHAEHGLELSDLRVSGLRQKLRRWARWWAFSRVDALVAIAEVVRERVRDQWRYRGDRLRLIPNGVDVPPESNPAISPHEIRAQLGIPSDRVVVGSIGRLAPVKNYGLAIDAVRILSQQGERVDLVLVGDGRERRSLEEQSRLAKVSDQVHIVGYQNNVGDWLRSFDFYVNSSHSEAMSLSILEAMAVGLPIVATDVGDNARLISGDGGCGAVVEAGNVEALAAAFSEFSQNHHLRRRLADRARRRHARHYSIRSMVTAYEGLYEDVLQNDRRKPIDQGSS